MSGAGVAGIVLSAVDILHHPVQPPPQVVLGPSLAVMKKQLLRPLPLLPHLHTVAPGDNNLKKYQ